jgi:16S rRNA (adenine1518-N6/adenine1519-N6)-dimethyltransferase
MPELFTGWTGDSRMAGPTPTLGNPRNTIEILNRYRFVFQKKYGQNFLIDTHVLNKIIKAADITDRDYVVEIGPGIGTMTQYLAAAAAKVTAIEIDRALIPILHDTLREYENVDIINEDVLKVDLKRLADEKNDGRPVKVVANLPYYITTPIIMGLFEKHVPVSSVTVMVQKEVADRMQAGPGTKDYGALSLAVQYYALPYVAANVPPNCFMPRPGVGSAVIRLDVHEQPPVQAEDEALLFAVIRASFNQRRKTLQNGLSHVPGLGISKELTVRILEEMGLSASVRGEALTLKQFVDFTNLAVRYLKTAPES